MELKKFDRVVTILMLLQTKSVVRAQDLADRFQVSLRTIYRDLKSLEHAGVPICAEAGVGYSLVDGYSLPPVMFTENEATSFIIAEKLVSKMTDADTAKSFSDAVNKIKAVLKSDEKAKVDKLENHVLVSTNLSKKEAGDVQQMPQLLNCINAKKVVEIEYVAGYNNQRTVRCVEPIGIHMYSDSWHLLAFCRLRMDYRDFRIDRILNLRVTSEHFEGGHPDLHGYLKDMAVKQDLTRLLVKFKGESSRYANAEKYYHGFVREVKEADGVIMEFLTPSIHGTAHWLLVFTDQVEIIEPVELKSLMSGLTKKLVDSYGR